MPIGIIGGSGIYEIASITEERGIVTPFGEPSGPYGMGEIAGVDCIFLLRHGPRHDITPSRVNYRANIWGFKELGAERLISVNAVGGISKDFKPGDIVLSTQIIDLVQGMRPSTFYDGREVVHVDFTEPYCPELGRCIMDAAQKCGIEIKSGTYICVNGPRLESRAEINFFAMAGADIVGMTAMPEAALARELELCYSSVCVVTNYAAGISDRKLTTSEVVETMKGAAEKVKALLSETLPIVPHVRGCPCKDALKDTKM